MALRRIVSDNPYTRRSQQSTRFASQTPGSDSQVIHWNMVDRGDKDDLMNDDEADLFISQLQFDSDETFVTNPTAGTQAPDRNHADADGKSRSQMQNGAKMDLNNIDILRGELKTVKEKLEAVERRAAAEREQLQKSAEEEKSNLKKQLSKTNRLLESKSRKLDMSEKKVKELAEKVKDIQKRDEQTETSQIASKDTCCGSSQPSSSKSLKRVRSSQHDKQTETTPVVLMDSSCDCCASPLKKMKLSESPDIPHIENDLPSSDSPIPPTFCVPLDENNDKSDDNATDITSCASSTIIPPMTTDNGIDILENLSKFAPLISPYSISKTCAHFQYETDGYKQHEQKLALLSGLFTSELIRLNVTKSQKPDLVKMKYIFQLVKCHLLNYFTVISRVYDLEKKNHEVPADVIAKLREARGGYLTWNQLEYYAEEKSFNPLEEFENLRLSVLSAVPLLDCSCLDYRHSVAVASLDLMNAMCSAFHQYSEYCCKLRTGKFKVVKQNDGSNLAQPVVIDLTGDDDRISSKVKAKELGEDNGILPLVCILATTKILPRKFSEITIKRSLELLVTLSANGHLNLTKCKEWLFPDYMNSLLCNWKVDIVIPKLLIDILFNCRNDTYIKYYSKECGQENRSRKSLLTGFASVFDDIIESIQCGELSNVHYETLKKSVQLLHTIFMKNKLNDIHSTVCRCWETFAESLCSLLFELNVHSNSYSHLGLRFTLSLGFVLKQIVVATKGLRHFHQAPFRNLDLCLQILAEKSESGKTLRYSIPVVPNDH